MGALRVDPGRLSTRLVLEEAGGLADGQGGVIEDWQPLASLWGRVEPMRAKSRETAGTATALISHRVTVRYRNDIRHTMRFAHRGRHLIIRAVRDPDETRRYLQCDCEEIRQ